MRKIMKAVAVAALMMVILASCSTTKKIKKSSREEVKVEQTMEAQISSVTTRKVDTVIIIKADSLEAQVNLEDTTRIIDTLIQDDHQEIHVSYNPGSKKLQVKAKIKPREVPVKLDETTTTQVNIKSHTTEQKTVITQEKDKEVKSSWWSWPLFFIVLLLILLLWFFYRLCTR